MSVATTNFTRISLRTTLADTGPMHLEVPSGATLEGAGTNTFSGAVTASSTFASSGVATFTSNLDASGATFLIDQQTASHTSLTLADGEMSVGSVSVTSATIYFRSGVTIYEFDAQAAGVL